MRAVVEAAEERCALKRHDLVSVEPAAWAAHLATRPDLAALPRLAGWAEAGRPLVVRRRIPGEAGAYVPLGLPLPPGDGRGRIALALPGEHLSPRPAPSLAEVAAVGPDAWRPCIAALVALGAGHGIAPRPFGGLLWQAVTGLAYLTPASDLDLLWPCAPPVPADLIEGIARISAYAPVRLDGEILLPDGAGIHWRELHAAPDGGTVLAKTGDGLALRPVAALRGGRAA